MSYKIIYSDVVAVRNQIVSYHTQVVEQLEKLRKSYNSLINSDQMTGNAADEVKDYLKTVHLGLLDSMEGMLDEYQNKMLVYENGLHKMDSDWNASIIEEELEYLIGALGRAKSLFGEITKGVEETLNSVSNIHEASAPKDTEVNKAYDKTKKIATEIENKMGTYDYKHRSDCKGVDKYIKSIDKILACQKKQKDDTITLQKIKEIKADNSFQDLLKLRQETAIFTESHPKELEEEKILMEQEAAAEARRKEGIILIAAGTVAVISMGITLGATGPAVAALAAGGGVVGKGAVAVVTVGAIGNTAYATSQIGDGIQNYYYGTKGDTTSVAFNPLKDNLFGGNNTAYEVFGISTALVSSGASELAKKGLAFTGVNLAKVVAKEGAKDVATGVTAMTAGEVVGAAGGSDGEQQLASITTAVLMGHGLNKLDGGKVGKVSNGRGSSEVGSYSGDLMSAEDAAEYSEHWRKLGIGSDKTWNEFKNANPNGTIDDYFKLVNEQSPWPDGYNPNDNIISLKEGDTFNMVLDNKQKVSQPGGFGIVNDVPNKEFARNYMAIKLDWKDDCGKMATYRVKAGKELNAPSGPIGPQIDLKANKYLPGNTGLTQLDLFNGLGRINRTDYIEVVPGSVRRLN